MNKFSVIVPTYNRAEYLTAVLDALKCQGNIDFECIIIDDGSKDNTKNVVLQYDSPYKITYAYQENAGKFSAINKGAEMANSHITLIHDDDDKLLPNVLALAWEYFDTDSGFFKENCACLSGLCADNDGKICGDKFPHDYYVSNHIQYRFNKNIKGDKAEFYVTSVLKKFPYPVFPDEKHIMCSIVWNRIALEYNTLYINRLFMIKDYLAGGLSDQKDKQLLNPKGAELFFNEATHKLYNFPIKLKNYAKYIYYSKKNGKNLKNIYSQSCNKNMFIPGLIFYYPFKFIFFLMRNKSIKSAYLSLENKLKKRKKHESII